MPTMEQVQGPLIVDNSDATPRSEDATTGLDAVERGFGGRTAVGSIKSAKSKEEEPPAAPVLAIPEKQEPDSSLVGWDSPEDPENPQNWNFWRKIRITVATASMTFCVSFASSVFSATTTATAVEYHQSVEVMILGVSLYVLGFSFGE
jgi:hypothetical protein